MIFPSLDCEAFEVKGFVLVRACVCVCVCVCASNTGLVHRNPPSLYWPPSLFL